MVKGHRKMMGDLSTPTVSGTMLTYKLADSAEVGKTDTITVPVTESTNYNPFDLTITVSGPCHSSYDEPDGYDDAPPWDVDDEDEGGDE